MKSNHFVAAIAILLAGLLVETATVQATNNQRPNVLIILVDDMGYGDPQCYNPRSKIPTPQIDSLARDGIRFTDAHAPGPLCHLSRYGLMTGRYPFRTDVSVWRRQPVIDADRMTIASLLKSHGYHTAMVGKWHLGFLENGYDKPLPGGPVDRGFDTYFGIRASTDIPPYFLIRGNRAVTPPTDHIEANSSEGWSPIQGAFWREGGIAPDLKLEDVLPRFTDEAIEIISRRAARNQQGRSAEPWMLYLAYPAPHTPWLPSSEFQGRSRANMYGDFAVMVDTMIGRVLRSLEENGMVDETLVVFTSDNGPVWYETDVKRFGHDSSGGLRGMKADAWEAGHRVPFIIRWPNVVKAGSVSDQVICFTDLMATFAAILGAELPNEAAPDSFSCLSVLRDRAATDGPTRETLVIPSGNGTMTVRVGDWKLITALGSGGFSKPRRVQPAVGGPQGQLYNLAADLGETTNLYSERPDIVSRLRTRLQEIRTNGRSRP